MHTKQQDAALKGRGGTSENAAIITVATPSGDDNSPSKKPAHDHVMDEGALCF